MEQAIEHYFELVEILCVIGLLLTLFPFLMGYWTKPLVTYADEKTALDTKGTIEEQESGSGSIFEVIMMCCVMEDDGCRPGEVKVTLDNNEVTDVSPGRTESWETNRISSATDVWSAAVRNYGGTNALGLGYDHMEYQPGTAVVTGSDIVTDEGCWLFDLE
jgi:hypothetical protein